MEYLPGRSMSLAIEDEMTEIAKALGLKGGVKELRQETFKAIKAHFRQGGGSTSSTTKTKGKENNSAAAGGVGVVPSLKQQQQQQKKKKNSSSGGGSDGNVAHIIDETEVGIMRNIEESGEGGYGSLLFQYLQGFVSNHLGGSMQLLRTYVDVRRSVLGLKDSIGESLSNMRWFLLNLFGFGFLVHNNQNSSGNKEEDEGAKQRSKIIVKNSKTNLKVNLDEKLHDMVLFHGYQLLFDGVFNADPHPGNIL
jgi:hypothetical protein